MPVCLNRISGRTNRLFCFKSFGGKGKKNIFKAAALLAAVLMLFCVTGCGDNAGGTPAEPPFVANETLLTLEAIAAGTITLTNPWSTLKYKKNGGDFVSVTASANTIAVAAGDKVALYANGSDNIYDSNTDELTAFCIACNNDCFVYGNVMSLLSSSDFKNATSISTEYAFARLFYENTHIKNHAQKALVLPVTTLANRCYYYMFYGCTSLTSSPVLPATTLELYCYHEMFKGCSNLSSVTCLATDISAYRCTYEWLDGVASTGTFTKASSMTSWTTGADGIPSGWTVTNAPQQ